MLFVNNLARNGTHAQKLKYLPTACSGASIGGMCMSEPGAGTDVMGMTTSAVASEDGSSYTLNGAKMWITNGTVDGQTTGDVFLVYARTSTDPRNGLTSFLVEKGMEGFSLGQKINDKCGMRASNTAELVFDNVTVPASNIVGSLGGATLCMMRNLEIERITLAAMSLGIARRSIEVMSNYSQERKAFGKSIGEFGQIQKMIAESYAEFMAGRAYTYSVAAKLDLDVRA
jgi:isovaleryl-CoA dehydrogenase